MKFAVPKLGQADEKKVNAARARWTKHFSARTGLVESATRVLVIPIFGTIPRHASTEWPECSGHCPSQARRLKRSLAACYGAGKRLFRGRCLTLSSDFVPMRGVFGLVFIGKIAGSGNRTRMASLEGWNFTIKLCPRAD
jgi:hypothetical protein